MTEVDLSAIANLVNEYRTAVAEKARWDSVTKRLSPLLKEVIGDNEYGTINGTNVLRRQVVNITKLDAKRLQEELPDLANRYMETTQQTRLTIVKQ